MKTLLSNLIILTISLILLSGCKKDSFTMEEGIYIGNFTVRYNSGIKTGPVTLELKNGEYNCSGNSNRIPAGGSGTYSVENCKVTFNEQHVWTADFDWGLILGGVYNYSFDGENLKISSISNNEASYEYVLKKK
nr:hypothetical protein [uncultured Pedobacter sp.]